VSEKLFEFMITNKNNMLLFPELWVFEILAFFLVDPVSEYKKCCGQERESRENYIRRNFVM
jgi:hypothetical protein